MGIIVLNDLTTKMHPVCCKCNDMMVGMVGGNCKGNEQAHRNAPKKIYGAGLPVG